MDNRGATMCQGKFDFGFAVDWMRKDLGICLAEAKTNGARLPVTALVDQFYGQVQARGGNRWDTSSLMQLLAKDRSEEHTSEVQSLMRISYAVFCLKKKKKDTQQD